MTDESPPEGFGRGFSIEEIRRRHLRGLEEWATHDRAALLDVVDRQSQQITELQLRIDGYRISGRPDAVTDGGCADAVTSCAPERVQIGDGAFFVVPKVIE